MPIFEAFINIEMEFYTKRRDIFLQELAKHRNSYNVISAARLAVALLILFLVYYSIAEDSSTLILLAIGACIVLFFILMQLHTAVSLKKARAATLVKLNTQEINYLSGKEIPFNDGAEFIDFLHPYTHDLDIFGNKSLFHNLNRTNTYKGKQKLALMLSKLLPQQDILHNQQAIKELAAKPKFRQELQAIGTANKDNESVYNKLLSWANGMQNPISVIAKVIAYGSPVLLFLCLIAYFVTDTMQFANWAGYVFGFNLVFMLACVKRIKNETKHTTEIHQIITNYSHALKQLEEENFESAKLRALQNRLHSDSKGAGKHIKKLAMLLAQMDTVNNLFGAALLNGLCLYHLHVLTALLNWKKEHAASIPVWLDVIAEAEALSSFANLYYNNPDFTFPEINSSYSIAFSNLAHPLLNKDTRIGNDITFNPGFTILTGSNMSGKSTFLRSLGINMVLAGAGAPVCAAQATVHPMPVLVSMRLSDSLSDSESYFFAEIKRLSQIMEGLKGQHGFVLLDEILRGTNSDDKQMGTIKVIEKMVQLEAVGAIATHDIEVCQTANHYPNQLVNRCFEVQIINDDLYFDYTLRDGICHNKSATFIMNKMGVI